MDALLDEYQIGPGRAFNELFPSEACSPEPVAYFAFALGETVAFRGHASLTGVVLGRMEDKNGRHYEIQYTVKGQVLRHWFRERTFERTAQPPGEKQRPTLFDRLLWLIGRLPARRPRRKQHAISHR